VHCPKCRSTAFNQRPERTAQGYRRLRCLDCTNQFNERSGGLLNRTQHPSDVIALVVLWRLHYKLSLRDLAKMFLLRGIVFSYEAVRDWEAKLTPALAEELRPSPALWRRSQRSQPHRAGRWQWHRPGVCLARPTGPAAVRADRGSVGSAQSSTSTFPNNHSATERNTWPFLCPGPEPTQTTAPLGPTPRIRADFWP